MEHLCVCVCVCVCVWERECECMPWKQRKGFWVVQVDSARQAIVYKIDNQK